jgi:hypothetical protein
MSWAKTLQPMLMTHCCPNSVQCLQGSLGALQIQFEKSNNSTQLFVQEGVSLI